MPEFNPFTSEFDPSVDPITADSHGLLTLEKLTASQELEFGADPAQYQADQIKLRSNLTKYEKYKKARGEQLFSYAPEVEAQSKARNEEELARYTVNLFKAGDASFDTILKDNGDYEDFKAGASVMDNDTEMRAAWSIRKSMQLFGYSDRMIDSGAAEPMFRSQIKAGEHEPTEDAIERWGLDKQNQLKRRRRIAESSSEMAAKNFLGMTGDVDSFEESIAEANPDITADERTMVRRIYNQQTQNLKKNFSKVTPLVRKTFNTIIADNTEDGGAVFTDEGDEAFSTEGDAIEAFSKLSDEDFSKVISMMSETAKIHGQDVDGFMNKWSKRVERAGSNFLDKTLSGGLKRKFAVGQLKEFKGNTPLGAVFNQEGEVVFAAPLSDIDQERIDFAIQSEGFDKKTGEPTRYFRKITNNKVERGKAVEYARQQENYLKYAARIRNWKPEVAKARSENKAAEAWVYGLMGDSMPEMAAAATGFVGMAVVSAAQYEENLSRYQERNPNMTAEQYEAADPALRLSAYTYAALNRLQWKTATKGMPTVSAYIKRIPQVLLFETVQETAQDLSYSTTLELYGAIDEDVKDLEMVKELGGAIKQFPHTMFAVAPLALAGVGGRAALTHLDNRSFERMLKDTQLLEKYGMDPTDIDAVQKMTAPEAVDYIHENNARFLGDMQETDITRMAMPSGEADITYDAETGNYTVANNGKSITAKTSEEAAEAAQQLDPNISEQINTQLKSLSSPKHVSNGKLSGLTAEAMADPASVNAKPIRWELSPEQTVEIDTPVGHPEITRGLENVLKVIGSRTPIRFSGRKVPKSASGVYYLKQRIIRVRKHNGVTTAAHEVAHAIEDQYLKGGLGDDKWVKIRSASPQMALELNKMGNDLYNGKAPTNTTMSEGFAEYFRMRIEGHDMTTIAPETHTWVEQNIIKDNPELAKSIQDVTDTAVKYAGQGALNRGRAGVVKQMTRRGKLKKDVIDFLKSTPDQFIDMLNPIKRIVDAAETELGKELKNNPYETASQLRMTHDAVVKYMVEEQMRDFTGNPLGPKTSLRDAVELIGKKKEDFTIYLWARRTMALDPSGRETGLSVEDAQFIIDELDSPAFQLAATRVFDWNNNVLQYAADSSKDFAEVVERIRDIDPGNYIPLFREFDALDTKYKSMAPGAHGGKLVKTLKGSTRRIKDPFESMISQARSLVLRANQRAVIEQVLDIAETVPNMGSFIFEVSPDNVPEAHRSVVELLDEVGRNVEGDLKDLTKQLRDVADMEGYGDQMVTLWGQAYMPPNQLENPIIPIFRNGKRRWYEVDRSAYEALMGMEVYRLSSSGGLGKFFDLTIGKTNRAFKLGTTGFRASFSMVTNPLRDFRTLMLNTQSEANMAQILGTWSKTIGEALIEALNGSMVFKTEWDEVYRRLGLEMSTTLGEDTKPTESAARRLFQGKVIRTIHPANILDYVRDLFQFAESATRITEMKLLAKEVGWDPSMPLTPELAQKLSLAAKRVTTDFTAAGATMRVLNQILPFSNAQVQGVNAHVRALKANPSKFILRGLYGSAASIGLWLQNKDEEWWKQMPMKEKYGYTYIPVGEELVRIPRAFEADGVFQAFPVAMLDAFYDENPEEAVNWAEEFLSAFVPSKPVLLSAYTEQKANKVDYFDRPIVPKSEEVLDVEGFRHLQYGPHNTRLSIELGKIFDVSPRRVDHGIKKFTGGAGADFVALFGRGPKSDHGEKREHQLSDIPVIGTVFSSVGQSPYSPKSIDDMYTKLEWANANRRVEGEEETKAAKQKRLILKDAASMMSAISELEKLEMNTTERRKLRALKVTIAKEASESFDSDEPSRKKFKKWEKEIKALQK